MTDRELMQQALEAVDWLRHHLTQHHGCLHMDAAASGIPAWLNKTETALRERLSQPEHEPVAWAYPEALEAFKKGKPWTAYGSSGEGRIPLYLNDAVAPKAEPRSGESGAGFESLPASSSTWWDEPAQMNYRKWQGLTDDEIKAPIQKAMQHFGYDPTQYSLGGAATIGFLGLVREIEAKLKEKNT